MQEIIDKYLPNEAGCLLPITNCQATNGSQASSNIFMPEYLSI